MAWDRSDVERWLMDAEAHASADEAAQVAWLKEQRALYSQRIREGDWEVQSVTGEGGSSSSKRHVSDKDNHDAIVAALREMGETEYGARGTSLTFQFSNILG